ncbi:MAG: ECF transporter S component [Clostridia bacterium]|nr:ECF transporter S component [Clostridia bacterium]
MDNKKRFGTREIAGAAMFASLAFAVAYLCQFIPRVQGFLTPDVKDAVIAIASFIFGPAVAPAISLVVAFLEFITFSTTGPWGFLMNFVSSSVFSLTASLIYRYKRSFGSAVLGLAVSVGLTTAVMLLLNPIIVPLYSGVSREIVIKMLPGILLPFNFAKTLLNSALTMLLYKPLISALRLAKLVPAGKFKTEFNKSTLLSVIIGAATLVGAFLILIKIW